jgi:haloalkane dehalogenase
MDNTSVSESYPFVSHYVEILNSKMHYIEQGSGDPILFLHGVPTSSYVWRNVVPHLSTMGRCIAVDLIGFGKSEKPEIDYSIADHIRYIEGFIKALNLNHVTLVMHGWGSIIGFHYAMHHQNNCKSLVFYESYIRSVTQEDFALPMHEQLSLFEDDTFDIIMNASNFVDKVMPQSMTRPLSEGEIEHYRNPFLSTGSGKPLQKYIEELPLSNNETNKLIDAYSTLLQKSTIPKLMIYSIPGFITTIATVIWAKEHLPNLEIIEIGEAMHFAQENDPVMMGETISVWMQGLEQSPTTRSE